MIAFPHAATTSAGQASRLRIGILGVGRVGSVLGAALARAGHRVVAGAGVSDASRRRAERLLPGVPLLPPDEVVRAADLVLVAVPDDVLPGLVEGLATTETWRKGQFVCHVAGGYGVSVLQPAVRMGALPLAIHPAMAFVDRPEDVDRLTGVCFAVTAPDALRLAAEALVVEMGGEPVWVPEENRPLYHAALSLGANHSSALIADALDLLRNAGISDPARVLAPLAEVALDNVLRLQDAGLTGPIVRGDANMVTRHLRVLAENFPELTLPYVSLARRMADRGLVSGRLKPEQVEALLDVLSNSVDGGSS